MITAVQYIASCVYNIMYVFTIKTLAVKRVWQIPTNSPKFLPIFTIKHVIRATICVIESLECTNEARHVELHLNVCVKQTLYNI